MVLVMSMVLYVSDLCCLGPLREPELEQLVEQLKNMGFDEVSHTVCLSVCLPVSLSVCLSVCL